MTVFTRTTIRIYNQLNDNRTMETALSFDPPIEDFWRLEIIGITDNSRQSDDERTVQHFSERVKKENGRYDVRWPQREKNPNLPDNYGLALRRLKSTLSKLQEDSELLRKYNKVIKDQLKNSIIEVVRYKITDDTNKHYIPHHATINSSSSSKKVQIVYDDSSKSKKSHLSLNECLYRRLIKLEELRGLLRKFRTKWIALTADIEKAFLQVGLNEADTDVTRFLRVKDIMEALVDSNLQVYRFTRIPFAIISNLS